MPGTQADVPYMVITIVLPNLLFTLDLQAQKNLPKAFS